MTARSTRRSTATHPRLAAVGAIAVAGALLLTGCGDQTKDKTNDSGSASSGAPLADKLPQSIRGKGKILVGSDIAYAPVEFKDSSGKAVGLDPDLAAALGKQLGVTFEFRNGTFDALLTGLRSGRYDIAMSAMTDNKDRQQGIDPDTGKKLSIEPFDDDQQSQTRLRSGGVDAASSDFPVAAYAAKTSGGGKDFQIVGDQVSAAPYGIAVSKESGQLRDALKAAMDAIIKNGEYQKILEKWGAQDGAVKESVINGGK